MTNQQFSILQFDPQKATSQEWKNAYSLYKKETKELYPIYPIDSQEKFKKNLLNPDPTAQITRWAVLQEGEKPKFIGMGNTQYYTKKHPEYEKNKQMAFGNVYIHPEYRRQGFGTTVLKFMLEQLKNNGKEVLQVGPINDTGLKFSKDFEGIFALKEEISLLKFNEVNWGLINKWQDPDAVKAKVVSVETFNDAPDIFIDQYCLLYTEILKQIPLGEIEVERKETVQTRRSKEERIKKVENIWTTIITKEDDGTPSGLTETFYDPEQEKFIYQGLTGVKKEYRGRGLGKLLKVKMLQYIKETFPLVEFVITDFAVTNDPMIAINQRLGFKNAGTMEIYKFNVSTIRKQLKLH